MIDQRAVYTVLPKNKVDRNVFTACGSFYIALTCTGRLIPSDSTIYTVEHDAFVCITIYKYTAHKQAANAVKCLSGTSFYTLLIRIH